MAGPLPRETPSLLIPSNFSNRTGFAWKAFFRVFDRVAAALHGDGVGVVLSFGEIEGPVEILESGVPHDSFVFDPFDITLGSLRRLRRKIREHRVRYVYWTDSSTRHWIYALMRLWGVRVIVVHSHISVESPHPAEPETGVRRLVKSILHRVPWLSADHVLTCSEFVKHRMVVKACCPAELITVLHYGLPDSSFAGDESAPASPGEPGSPDAPLHVFCAARATRVKGIHVLIEATRLLRERPDLPGFVVEFAGDGPDLEAFRAQAEEAGVGDAFRFLGYVDDVTPLMQGADVVVIPSIWGDAFPYSVLEAMAAGKAIVASRAGGVPEELGDPPTGLLVAPGDAPGFADAIAWLLTDPRRRSELAAAAGARARAEFREERYFTEVIEYLRRAFGIAGG